MSTLPRPALFNEDPPGPPEAPALFGRAVHRETESTTVADIVAACPPGLDLREVKVKALHSYYEDPAYEVSWPLPDDVCARLTEEYDAALLEWKEEYAAYKRRREEAEETLRAWISDAPASDVLAMAESLPYHHRTFIHEELLKGFK